MARRILLVEDEDITREIVRGILQARGYVVEVATDGLTALERLCAGGFDLALMDYHLPEVDGYASARLMGSVVPVAQRPKMVALTADPRSLADRPGAEAMFDAVLAKPFDAETLCALIERLLADPMLEEAVKSARALWRARGLRDRPRAFTAPAASPEQANALRQYFGLVTDPRSADVMVLVDPDRLDDLVAARRHGEAHLLPTVDVTGARARELDAAFHPDDPATWSAVANAIRDFRERAGRLSAPARFSNEAPMRLMAQLFVSDRALEPIPDPNDRRFFAYTGAAGGERLSKVANDLSAQGLLARSFAERFHVCVECTSHRMNVREECPCCRSPDLSEVKLLRHFRCGAVSPEDECRDGDWFSCPKCAQSLGRYGDDYARAGSVVRCGSCGEARTEPAIGFMCLDCGAHADGEAVETQDIFAYALTSRAVRLLTSRDNLSLRAAPAGVRERAARVMDQGRKAVVAEIRFVTAERVIAAEGFEAFETLRRLFIENLQTLLGDGVEVVRARDQEYIVLPDVSVEEFAASQQAMVKRCEEPLPHSLGARISILEAA